MAELASQHGWIYQYKPAETDWLIHLALRRRVDWRVSRWAKDTHPGDLVFFWESGAKGGLRGYGRIVAPLYPHAEEKRKVRVPVEAMLWLATPVPRNEVEMSGALLSSNLFLSMTQGANFPLEPEEVKSLLQMLGVSESEAKSSLAVLAAHPPSVASAHRRAEKLRRQSAGASSAIPDPEDEEEVADLTFDGDREGGTIQPLILMTKPAQSILDAADSYRADGFKGPISSTRLFIAALDPSAWGGPSRGNYQQEVARGAVEEVAKRNAQALHVLWREYRAQQEIGHEPSRSFTPNADRILDWARASEFSERAAGFISADGILAALLCAKDGRFIERLERVGLSLEGLRAEILEEVMRTDKEVFQLWERAFTGLPRPFVESAGPIGTARVGNDNPWNSELKDSLGADREAQAFAKLCVSKEFVPPLAVGVFGHWGSGKSFFLRLVHDHIKKQSKPAIDPSASGNTLAHVVQINFNAWHYVETNLWASLVDHIFSELDRATADRPRAEVEQVFDQLTTARELTLAAAENLVLGRKEQEDAAAASAEAELRLKEKRVTAGKVAKVSVATAVETYLGHLNSLRPEEGEATSTNDSSELRDQAKLQKHLKSLGLSQVASDGVELRDALLRLDEGRRNLGLLVPGLLSVLGSRSYVLLFVAVAAVFFLGTWGVPEVLEGLKSAPALQDVLQNAILRTSGIVASVVVIVGKATVHVSRAAAYLKRTKGALVKALSDAKEREDAALKPVRDELARLEAEAAEAKKRLTSCIDLASEAAREFNAKTGRGRLLSFIRSRAAGETYAQHLGLISTVRKDFEELSHLVALASAQAAGNGTESQMRQVIDEENDAYLLRIVTLIEAAGGESSRASSWSRSLKDKNRGGASTVSSSASNVAEDGFIPESSTRTPSTSPPLLSKEEIAQLDASTMTQEAVDGVKTVGRIVLYIDDLDRCKPETVVEVLQAVHLLLSFRLFIVFVAVDVRWVTRALQDHYPQLLGPRAGKGAASAQDYLEKVFQVPYWVRPSTAENSREFMRERLRLQGAMKATEKGGAPDAEDIADKKSTPIERAEIGAPLDSRAMHGDSAPSSSLLGTRAGENSAKNEAPTDVIRDDVVPVALSKAECDFMIELACWAGDSPRRLLRFMNVYQVMKACLDPNAGAEDPNDHCLDLMAQAAIVTGAPDLLERWHQLLNDVESERPVSALPQLVLQWKDYPKQARAVTEVIGALAKRRGDSAVVQPLRRYAEISKRFCFTMDMGIHAPLPVDTRPRFWRRNGPPTS